MTLKIQSLHITERQLVPRKVERNKAIRDIIMKASIARTPLGNRGTGGQRLVVFLAVTWIDRFHFSALRIAQFEGIQLLLRELNRDRRPILTRGGNSRACNQERDDAVLAHNEAPRSE